ncbi:MAG: adenosylmethionine--8-amino-7-oxononanoate transaminase [Burkholderiaceae bacterium]|jgi:adenosylmethionine-8-amino-7-oxononanoate aminotransferase|nr:adenosylmethionine--8-amino-7-oxononanoate transaminase [Burkholderiaceae bacterium]
MQKSGVLPSFSLAERSRRSVWHPCTQMQKHASFPIVALGRGEGAWLFDEKGTPYLDAISSWWTNLFGHAHPYINAALKEQLDTLEHAMLAGFTHEPVVRLSERLSDMTGGVLGHCFYASDGASAVEIALKMSVHAWRNENRPDKREFVCLRGSYHGETIGALSVTDVPLFRQEYEALLRAVHIVPAPDTRGESKKASLPKGTDEALQVVEALFSSRADHIAALIIEPLVQCAAGFVMHEPLYVRGLRQLCDRFHVHLIADEIAVGCGRTGTFFACEQAGIWPDFMCLSKGISGGYLPLSLVMTRDEIYSLFYDESLYRGFLHSHSYTGNPLACRAALATLDLFDRERILEKNRRTAQVLTDALDAVRAHEHVRHFRCRGMIWAFEVDLPEPDEAARFPQHFFAAALRQGLLLRPIGNTVYLLPPYVVAEREIDMLAERLPRVLKEVLAA